MIYKTKRIAAAVSAAVLTFIFSAVTASAAVFADNAIDAGDGRTYKALAVFGVAAVVIVVLVILGKKKK